jgi:transcriptional regulator with XRE-family HTH domain
LLSPVCVSDVTKVTNASLSKQVFRKKYFTDFFYNQILDIDMVNETIKVLIANNGGNKKIIAGRLGITPQFLGQLERGERKKPSAELVHKIKEVYGIDILTGKQVETTVSRETPPVVAVREDFWQDIKASNEFFRSQNNELLSIVKELIHGRVIPKQA